MSEEKNHQRTLVEHSAEHQLVLQFLKVNIAKAGAGQRHETILAEYMFSDIIYENFQSYYSTTNNQVYCSGSLKFTTIVLKMLHHPISNFTTVIYQFYNS